MAILSTAVTLKIVVIFSNKYVTVQGIAKLYLHFWQQPQQQQQNMYNTWI